MEQEVAVYVARAGLQAGMRTQHGRAVAGAGLQAAAQAQPWAGPAAALQQVAVPAGAGSAEERAQGQEARRLPAAAPGQGAWRMTRRACWPGGSILHVLALLLVVPKLRPGSPHAPGVLSPHGPRSLLPWGPPSAHPRAVSSSAVSSAWLPVLSRQLPAPQPSPRQPGAGTRAAHTWRSSAMPPCTASCACSACPAPAWSSCPRAATPCALLRSCFPRLGRRAAAVQRGRGRPQGQQRERQQREARACCRGGRCCCSGAASTACCTARLRASRCYCRRVEQGRGGASGWEALGEAECPACCSGGGVDETWSTAGGTRRGLPTCTIPLPQTKQNTLLLLLQAWHRGGGAGRRRVACGGAPRRGWRGRTGPGRQGTGERRWRGWRGRQGQAAGRRQGGRQRPRQGP